MSDEIYERLSAPFDEVFTDTRGGVSLTYITGEQCVSRLNEVLGVNGWSFRVLEHGVEEEADELWALGELTATIDGLTVTRQQFGSQKYKRRRADQQILDVGFDLKGATTDAMKKCASLLGVGLYLAKKQQPQRQSPPIQRAPATPKPAGPTSLEPKPSLFYQRYVELRDQCRTVLAEDVLATLPLGLAPTAQQDDVITAGKRLRETLDSLKVGGK